MLLFSAPFAVIAMTVASREETLLLTCFRFVARAVQPFLT